MKSVLSLLIITLFLLGFSQTSSFSQEKFEGKIVMKMTADDNIPHKIEYYFKGSKLRIEGGEEEGQMGAMVIDFKGKTVMIIMPQQKMYMEYPLGPATDKGQTDKTEEKKEEGDFKMTGETKDILGYKCEKMIYTDKDGTRGEAWIAKGLGSYLFMADLMSDKNQPERQKKLEREGYFPMVDINKDSNGKVKSTMEVISIEKKLPDESLFIHPADYKKMEMPTMNK